MTNIENAEIFVRKVMAIFGQELDTKTFRETVRKVMKTIPRENGMTGHTCETKTIGPEMQAIIIETAAERDRLREINAELREAAQNLIEFLEKSVNAGPISNKPKPERLLLACLRAAIAKATGEAS